MKQIPDDHPIHWHFWKPAHRKELEKARTFTDLAMVAQMVFESAREPLHILSGPMTSGGIGNGDKHINMHVINRAAEFLWAERGLRLISHHPFETKLGVLHAEWKARVNGTGGYCWELLEEFYGRILNPHNIAGMHFLDDWQSSTGSRWERKCCQERSIPIFDLGRDFSEMILDLLKKEGHAFTA